MKEITVEVGKTINHSFRNTPYSKAIIITSPCEINNFLMASKILGSLKKNAPLACWWCLIFSATLAESSVESSGNLFDDL